MEHLKHFPRFGPESKTRDTVAGAPLCIERRVIEVGTPAAAPDSDVSKPPADVGRASPAAQLDHPEHEFLEQLTVALEFRSGHTGGHARRVGATSAALAAAVGIRSPEAELYRLAGSLHDIGKIGVPDSILLKPGTLTAAEWEAMKRHTLIGWRILDPNVFPPDPSRLPALRLAAEIALSHHERMDGSGYPEGLQGEQIPLSARIVAVADTFDALVSSRPYKAGWSVEAAEAELLRGRGDKFDPCIVDAFLSMRRADPASLPATRYFPKSLAA